MPDNSIQPGDPLPVTRADIVRVARSFIGTKFHHQGRLKGAGVDCIGLVVGVCAELSMPLVDYNKYSMRPDGTELRREISKRLDEIPLDKALPGDVAIFKVGLYPRHVGILSDVGVIHTYRQAGKVVEHRMDEDWMKRMIAIFRFRGIT